MFRKLMLLPVLFFFYVAAAQTPEQLINKVREQYNPEKIYIHYDKANYLAGETIWFKAYMMEGFLPASGSTVLNVQLLNDSGRITDTKILPVMQGIIAAGNFDLPKTLRGGSYTVRAYTRRMMNFGTDKFYTHALNITNPDVAGPAVNDQKDYNIYFLPEGGNIVAGVKSVVAFKCTDKLGYPVSAEGKIINASGKEIVSFKSAHDGMGKFEFTAVAGENYAAQCILGSFLKKDVPLPAVNADGIGFAVVKKDGKTFFEIDKSVVVNERYLPAYILGVEENNVAFNTPLGTGKKLSGMIPVESLPSGILQLTVFNKADEPLAERLVFVNSGDHVAEGKFSADITGLKPREKNEYSFDLADTITGTYSVAVTDAESEQSKYGDNIISHFLMTGDLKGFIYEPGYYFEDNDDAHKDNLDLVMLTNGWRRYSWNELKLNVFSSMSFKDPNYITFSGTVFDPATGKPFKNANMNFFVNTKDSSFNSFTVPVNDSGRFIIPGLIFTDTATFTFRNNSAQDAKTYIKMDPFSIANNFVTAKGSIPPAKFYALSGADIAKRKHDLSAGFNEGILLDEVILKTQGKTGKEKTDKKYSYGSLGSNAEYTYDFVNNPPSADGRNIFDYLRGRVPGLSILGGPDYVLNYRQTRSLTGGPVPMTVYLDEIPVNVLQMSTLRVEEIALVKVYSSGPLVGPGGALAIYTRKDGDRIARSPFINLSIFRIPGFAPVKDFFSPDYSTAEDRGILKDERTTLYWNPYLTSDAQHKKISFAFYNSDKAKRLKVVLEGLTEDGKLLHVEKIIE